MKKERSKKYKRIQTLRIITQIIFFALFFFLLLQTRFPGQDYIRRVEVFFHFDPLLAAATFIASRTVFFAFIYAAITLLVTIVMGRVVCGWICPMGSLHQFFSWIFKKTKLLRPQRLKIFKDKRLAWKYYLLLFLLISTLFTLDLVGIFDPFSLLFRSFAVGVLPAVDHTIENLIGLVYKVNLYSVGDGLVQFFESLAINATFIQGFFISAIFIGLVMLNMYRERFWCRYLCPLGAFLGLASRFNLLKLKVSEKKCIKCNLCTIHCQTQANPWPDEEWKRSECDYCFTCSAICPTNAITFPIKTKSKSIETVDLSRRKVILTSFMSVVAVPFFRISPEKTRASERLIRPPGALSEAQFLQKCVRCGECMKVCPTNALQPAWTEAGPEGIWTPVLVPEIGYCEYYCSLCTQVCPTGAIKDLSIEAKNQVCIGTAWIDKNRCIPWKFGDSCIVCEEHCPVSPKAIKFIKIDVPRPDGVIKTPLAPQIEVDSCTGCGVCQNKCPVVDQPAIYVTSVGETRSEQNQMRLELIQPDFTLTDPGEDIYK
ncbi:4Fe-4S binding protein [Acidobacteriota bacterium]